MSNSKVISQASNLCFHHKMHKMHSAHSLLKHNASAEFSSQFDYVFVFKMKETRDGSAMVQSDVAKHCMNAMINAGLEIYPYLSIQQDELIVLVCCPVGNHLFIVFIYFFLYNL